MNYDGQLLSIPLGQMGLFTDAAQSNIPNTGLIRSNNTTFYNGVLQKDFGSRIWNSTPLSAGIVRAIEFFVDSQSQQQRIFALCSDGSLQKFSNSFTSTIIAPLNSTIPPVLNSLGYCSLVGGGNEVLGNPKKLFVFDGKNTPQVVYGDANTRNNIALPAFDWTGSSQPFGGVIHRGQMYAFGSHNTPHNVYASNVANHEDFQTVNATQFYNIYPGEYDGIVCLAVFRGRLFAFKYPRGVYYLVDTDPSPLNWYFTKQSDDFGACSPQSAAIVQDDMWVANNYGSLSSMKAALIFGDLLQKDAFYLTYCYRFAEQEINPGAHQNRHNLYYSARKQLLTCFQSNVGTNNDRISVFDQRDQQAQLPKVSWINKDQPNCLLTMRDGVGIDRPFYGSSDGNLYQMGVEDRWVGSATNTANQKSYLFDAQTPHMDFGQGNVYSPGTGNLTLASQMKLFEFLEIEYEPTGDWNVMIDVFVDGFKRGKPLICNLGARTNLDEVFMDANPIDGLQGFFRRFPLIGGQGRTISLRFYNNGLGQDVRLVRAIIYYRLSGQQQMVK